MINGENAVVGARGDDDNGPISGAAYLFDTATGQQTVKLLRDDGASYDYFGVTVAISGATVVVGAPADDDNGSNSGSAYLFDASVCPWDLDANGTVGILDLLTLLANWGACA